MIKNIIFDMGNVLLKFDRNYFLDAVGVKPADRRTLMNNVYLSLEWAKMDRVNNVLVSTNGIENFWKQLKVSIRSTHVSVSHQHMPKYLGEFTFRANHRQEVNLMFDRLIAKF